MLFSCLAASTTTPEWLGKFIPRGEMLRLDETFLAGRAWLGFPWRNAKITSHLNSSFIFIPRGRMI
jgi:hypothetical protein